MNTWTPCPDAIVQELGLIPAIVYGRIWRFCQNRSHSCYASLETIAKAVGLSRTAVYEAIHGSKQRSTHQATIGLINAGYLTLEGTRGETNLYRLTDAFFLGAAITGDDPTSTPSEHTSTPSERTSAPSETKIQLRDKQERVRAGAAPPTPLLPPMGFPKTDAERNAIRREALRLDRAAKKAAASSATAIAAQMGPEVREKARSYLSAYLNGISPNGHEKQADDAMIVANGVHVLDIPPEYTPEDFGEAAAYFATKWDGMVSVRSVRAHLAEWDAKGRPSERQSSGPTITWG